MIYAILSVVWWAFMSFFFLLDVWYFGLLPFFFLLFFFSQGFTDFKLNVPNAVIGDKYGLYLLSLLVFLGAFGILSFLGLQGASALWALLGLSGILRGASYLIPYPDGKELFKYWLLLTGILLLCNQLLFFAGEGFLSLFGAVLLARILFFGLMCYGIPILTEGEKELEYYFFFLLTWLIIYGLLALIEQRLRSFDAGLLFWSGILGLLWYIQLLPAEAEKTSQVPSLRRILAGERILKKEKKADWTQAFFSFLRTFKTLPLPLKSGIEWTNVILLLGVLISYLRSWFHGEFVPQLAYRGGTLLFLCNAFLLKKNQAFGLVSRFASALVINFSPYIFLLNLGGARSELIPWLIARNIVCGVALLYSKLPFLKKLLQKADLLFRLISNLIAMLLNILLLLKEPISGQLLFSLVVFYIGIQGALAYYALNVIATFADPEAPKNGEKADLTLEKMIEKELWPVG